MGGGGNLFRYNDCSTIKYPIMNKSNAACGFFLGHIENFKNVELFCLNLISLF